MCFQESHCILSYKLLFGFFKRRAPDPGGNQESMVHGRFGKKKHAFASVIGVNQGLFWFLVGDQIFLVFGPPTKNQTKNVGAFLVQNPAERGGEAGIETDSLVFPFVSAGDQKFLVLVPPTKNVFGFWSGPENQNQNTALLQSIAERLGI